MDIFLPAFSNCIDVIELARGPYWENIDQVLSFLQVYGPNRRKKRNNKRTRPIFPQYGPHGSSIKVLLLWLYFEFPNSTAHF